MSSLADAREILCHGTSVNLYWSRVPGKFVYIQTGEELRGIEWSGTVREWYECLVETIIDASFRLKDRESNFCVTSPDVATILECSVLFRPFLDATSQDEMPPGVKKCGLLSGRFTVYSDLHFPRNKILVGQKSGCVVDADPSACGSVTILDLLP